MQIQVNTDSSIESSEKLIAHVQSVVEATLDRFNQRVTRVEVHLSDENKAKGGHDDQRCLLEARLAGRLPTAVTHRAETLHEAVAGAAEKLKRSLESTLGRVDAHR
ncbi:MAG: HPF/RaiA family ribosome-associated protein [Deltaproteobacteria bacterium]